MPYRVVLTQILIFGLISTAHASVVHYRYAGRIGQGGASTTDYEYPCYPGTNDCAIQNITIDLWMPELAANLPLQAVTPDRFRLSDGLSTVDDSTAGFDTIVSLATGDIGEIIHWEIRTNKSTEPDCSKVEFVGLGSHGSTVNPIWSSDWGLDRWGYEYMSYSQGKVLYFDDDRPICTSGLNFEYDSTYPDPYDRPPDWQISAVSEPGTLSLFMLALLPILKNRSNRRSFR